LLEEVSESIGVSKGQFGRQTRRLELLSRNRADPDTDTICPARPGRVPNPFAQHTSLICHKAAISNRLHSDKRHSVKARAQGEGMFVVSKIVWAGIIFTFLTTGILGPRPTPLVSRSTISDQQPAVAHDSDVKQMQQSLRDKGHYRGKVDGVIGLRTRASIRAYQKAENLPITGGVDSQTAGKLGVGPESSGGSFKRAGHRRGEGLDNTGHEIGQGKPSAGIKWAKGRGRASKQLRKEASGAADPEAECGDCDNKQQAENEKQK